jgi:hypothetical protein
MIIEKNIVHSLAICKSLVTESGWVKTCRPLLDLEDVGAGFVPPVEFI